MITEEAKGYLVGILWVASAIEKYQTEDEEMS